MTSSPRPLTHLPQGHILANRNVWSADGLSLLYDLRDEETQFNSRRIERVFVDSLETELLYESPPGSCCGVPTASPVDDRYVFIHGPENATEDWQYCAWHRRGVLGRLSQPGLVTTLDARDIVSPYTAGALRGGTHLHTFSPNGTMIASTYEDHVLASLGDRSGDSNRRVVAISLLGRDVKVPPRHPRNHHGCSFTVVVTQVHEHPACGSDEIYRAYSEAWIDDHRLAFHADVLGPNGQPHSELFIVSLPVDLTQPGSEPLEGTATTRPGVPLGVNMRRLTHTDHDPSPGLAGPRHWAVASHAGDRIGCFRRDRSGHAQFHTANVASGELCCITSHPFSASSAFTWHPNGKSVAYAADGSVFQVFLDGRVPRRLTPRQSEGNGPTHHACVFSPDGSRIAFMQPVVCEGKRCNQIFCVDAVD
ncbi:MAG: DUF3748 domain-containing protein [Planctomycetaceae bacterium]